ncbi:MAG: glycosyl transferase [Chthoniobacterales bacterium]
MKRFYCTYFDRNYLVRGLALVRSLREHTQGDWELFVICMDDDSRRLLERFALPNITAVSIEQIERDDPELAAAKSDRTRVEYLWTTTPAIILWLMEKHAEIELLAYLDADLFFFSSPEPIFDELGDNSVLIHEHRYTPELKDMEANGKYNVGLLCFRNDERGNRALRWWRERCIESCHLDVKNGKCGDQMYLNDWPERFSRVHVLENRGAGVAPWNVDQFVLNKIKGRVLVEDVELIFYHFHSLRIVGPEEFRLAYRFYIRPDVAELIYRPYTEALSTAMRDLQRIEPDFQFNFSKPAPVEKVWDILFSFHLVSRAIAAVRQAVRQA